MFSLNNTAASHASASLPYFLKGKYLTLDLPVKSLQLTANLGLVHLTTPVIPDVLFIDFDLFLEFPAIVLGYKFVIKLFHGFLSRWSIIFSGSRSPLCNSQIIECIAIVLPLNCTCALLGLPFFSFN